MERKRELTSVDIAALVPEFEALRGVRVEKVYLYEPALLRVRMREPETGRIELLLEVGEQKRAHVADPATIPDAPDRPPDFAMQLRNRLDGAALDAVDQHGFDRVLLFEFEREGQRATIVAELFGDGNLVVLNAEREVVQCLRTVRLQSRTVAAGARYEFPDPRFDPTSADRDAFIEQVRESDTDLVRTLATRLTFGGLWAEEVCTRAGVEKSTPVEAATDETLEALHAEVATIGQRLRGGELDPRVYTADEEGEAVPVDATPLALEEYTHLASDRYETFGAALDAFFAATESAAAGDQDRPDFEAEIAEHQRIITQQQEAIDRFEERATATRRHAELLYAHYDLVDEILTTVRDARAAGHTWEEIADRLATGREAGIGAAEAVREVDPDEGTVTVALENEEVGLDPSMGVEKNADRLYQEAKRIEEKKAGAEAAVADTRADLAAIHDRRDRWETEGSTAETGDDADPGDWLSRSSIPVRRTESWHERFRWFHTSDDFLVVGGRDADQNEELVKRYMEPGDLFFHAEAHGGPATILKATGPSEPTREVDVPDRSCRQAAQFAVAYSSVWGAGQHSGDAYSVAHDQVSKTPESGEYLEKGGFAIRGDRTYYRDLAVRVAVGVQCEPETRVLGGPPDAIRPLVETSLTLEPGRYAQNDAAKLIYRELRSRFTDTSFVRRVASADEIQRFLPPGGSRLLEE